MNSYERKELGRSVVQLLAGPVFDIVFAGFAIYYMLKGRHVEALLCIAIARMGRAWS